MPCHRIPGGVVCTSPEYEVAASGRRWRFELTYFGPVVLRRDGQPRERQPGERSPFWPAFAAWNEQRKAERTKP